MPKDTILDLSLRRMFCDFLAISLLIALARSEDNIEKQLQYYLTGRAHVEGFRARIPDQLTRLGPGSREDLLKKLGVVLAFDFEAAVRLKSWDSLELIIEVRLPFFWKILKLISHLGMRCSERTTYLRDLSRHHA